ncbi:MAG: hypothetical protein ACHREM_25570 [Polyangiales bacterium]
MRLSMLGGGMVWVVGAFFAGLWMPVVVTALALYGRHTENRRLGRWILRVALVLAAIVTIASTPAWRPAITGIDPAGQPMGDGVWDIRKFIVWVILGLVVAVVAYFKREVPHENDAPTLP